MSPERYQKILAVLKRRQLDLTVVMEDVHKPHNLAAIVRSCDAVGIHQIHVVADRPRIRLRHKAASGCYKWVQYQTHTTTRAAYDHLRKNGFRILAAHPGSAGTHYRAADYTQPSAIVVGAELQGLSRDAIELADGQISIPQIGMVRSLNVSVAVALILFEAMHQRRQAGGYHARQMDDAALHKTAFEWAYPRISRYCRERGLPYPRLNMYGEIIESLADRRPAAAGDR